MNERVRTTQGIFQRTLDLKATTTNDIALKLTMSKHGDDYDHDKKVEVLDVMEGALQHQGDESSTDWYLCPTTSVHSTWRDHFMKFFPLKHKKYKCKLACNLCFEYQFYANGTVFCKADNTSGHET